MEDRGPSTVWIAGVAVGGCLLLLCCCFVPMMGGAGYYYWQRQRMDYWSSYDYGTWATAPSWDNTTVAYEEVAWGDLRFIGDPTHIYSTASTSSTVLETRASGEKVSYFGFDDTGMFFKAKAADGTMGFVSLNEAEMEVHLGDLRVTTTTAQIYETASDSAASLEQKYKDDMVPWYGFDASGNYYKVRNSLDTQGYMKVTEAEIPW